MRAPPLDGAATALSLTCFYPSPLSQSPLLRTSLDRYTEPRTNTGQINKVQNKIKKGAILFIKHRLPSSARTRPSTRTHTLTNSEKKKKNADRLNIFQERKMSFKKKKMNNKRKKNVVQCAMHKTQHEQDGHNVSRAHHRLSSRPVPHSDPCSPCIAA